MKYQKKDINEDEEKQFYSLIELAEYIDKFTEKVPDKRTKEYKQFLTEYTKLTKEFNTRVGSKIFKETYG